MFEQVPLFKHGPDEHDLVSLWQDTPVLYWLHWQMYCCLELMTHTPWLEQLAKHDDKSPVYVCNTLFKWLPELIITKEVEFDIFVDNSEVDVVMSAIVDVETGKESENEIDMEVSEVVDFLIDVVSYIDDAVDDLVEFEFVVVVFVDVVVLVVVVVEVVVIVALKK